MDRIIMPGEDDGRIAIYLAERLNTLFHPPFVAMACERGGAIVAGMLFNTFTGPDIHVSIAGSIWTRRFLRAFGWYLFSVLKVERFTGITEQQNVIDIVERLGGQREGVMRNHFGCGRHGIVLGVLRDEYRYRDGFHSEGARPNGNGAGPV